MALLLLFVAPACERYLDSRDPDFDSPAAGPVSGNLQAFVNDGTVVLTWQLESGTALHYQVYRAVGAAGEFARYDSTAATTIVLSDLRINQDYLFYVAAVGSNRLEGTPSDIVSARPSRLAITIEQGREYTDQREVDVEVTAPDGTTDMMLSEDSTFAGANWETFASPAPFVLSTGDGVKNIYARLQFADGSLTGDTLTDAIILDTYAEISAVTISPDGTTLGPGDEVTFVLSAGEAGGVAFVSFGETDDLPLFDDGLSPDAVANDGLYTGVFSVPSGYRLANGLVAGHFVDAAGNVALDMTATSSLNIQSPPQAPVLAAVGLSTYQIQLSWAGSDADGVVAYQIYRSTNANVTTSSDLVSTVSPDDAPQYIDTMLNAGTTYYYRLYAIGSAEQMVGSEVESAATVSNSTPDAVVLTASLAAANTVQLTWTASAEDDFAAYHIYYQSSPGVSMSSDQLTVVEQQDETSYDHFLEAGETRYYRIYVLDRHGSASAGSNVVSVTIP
jgi:fibronectin type 3 domain-containing protein